MDARGIREGRGRDCLAQRCGCTIQGMTDQAAARLGRKGGKNSRKYLEPEEAAKLARKAAGVRWEKYYKDHPEKRRPKKKRASAS